MYFPDTRSLFTFAAAAAALAFPSAAPAQLIYSTPGVPVVEKFNHPVLLEPGGARGTLLEWRDNETFRGWHAAYHDGVLRVFDTPTRLFVSEGRSRSDTAFLLYRTETERFDGALGTQPSDQRCPGVESGGIFLGVCLFNATNTPLTRLVLSYRVELYRVSAEPRSPQTTLFLDYRVDGDSLGEGRWTPVPAGRYVTPVANSGSSSPLNADGNIAPYASPYHVTIGGFTLPPGRRLWIRWLDVNNGGVDHGIGLDDVSITLLP